MFRLKLRFSVGLIRLSKTGGGRYEHRVAEVGFRPYWLGRSFDLDFWGHVATERRRRLRADQVGRLRAVLRAECPGAVQCGPGIRIGLARSSHHGTVLPLRGRGSSSGWPDAMGQYDDEHRATVFSGNAGSYQFESNFPPSYSGRPPHIHVRVSAEGYGTLVTQHYPVQGQTEATFDLVLIPAP